MTRAYKTHAWNSPCMGSLHCNVSNAKMHPTQRQEDEFIEKKRMEKCPINTGEKQCSKLYYTVGFLSFYCIECHVYRVL